MRGIILGRFQPFHIAHEAMVHEVIADGLKPLLMLGSANAERCDKNPYSAMERSTMINIVFPSIEMVTLDDCLDNWDLWVKAIQTTVESLSGQVVFYINDKETDRTYFEFKGKLYNNQFYTQIFKDLGYEVRPVTYPRALGLDINATDIRKNIDSYKHFLDGRVYRYLKSLGDN